MKYILIQGTKEIEMTEYEINTYNDKLYEEDMFLELVKIKNDKIYFEVGSNW